MKVLVGLSSLPRTLSLDDPRLPWIPLTNEPLRLNTHPVPPVLLAETPNTHEARVAALTSWLQSQADQWSVAARRTIADYMASLSDVLARHDGELARRLTRYDGLFAPQDYLWSALRPLPRAWILQPDAAPVFSSLAFWDGRSIGERSGSEDFWQDETLPSSPFRRRMLPPLKSSSPAHTSRPRTDPLRK